MKRGRPSIRNSIQKEIINILLQINTPITISIISREVSQIANKSVSWNTIQKYLQELVEAGKVQAIQLPHSKNENKAGLIVYALKK